MKGVAGNIGATNVQSTAAELEEMIRQRRTQDELQIYVTALQTAVHNLAARLRKNLQTKPEKAPSINLEKLSGVFEQLIQSLEQSDVQASDIFLDNQTLFQAAFPDQYGSIRKFINSFDYESALCVLLEAQKSTALPGSH